MSELNKSQNLTKEEMINFISESTNLSDESLEEMYNELQEETINEDLSKELSTEPIADDLKKDEVDLINSFIKNGLLKVTKRGISVHSFETSNGVIKIEPREKSIGGHFWMTKVIFNSKTLIPKGATDPSIYDGALWSYEQALRILISYLNNSNINETEEKLDLFGSEKNESEFEENYDLPDGRSVYIRRNKTYGDKKYDGTVVVIGGLNFLGKQSGVQFRFSSTEFDPSNYTKGRDIVMPELNNMPLERIKEFVNSVYNNIVNNKYQWNTDTRSYEYNSNINEGGSNGDYEHNEKCKEDAEALYDKGHELYKQGKHEEAEKLRQKALKVANWLDWDETELPKYESLNINEEEITDEADPMNDCFIESNGWKYSVSCSGEAQGDFEEMEEALLCVKNWKIDNKFFPNTWFISDHGNINLIDDDGNMINENNITDDKSKREENESKNNKELIYYRGTNIDKQMDEFASSNPDFLKIQQEINRAHKEKQKLEQIRSNKFHKKNIFNTSELDEKIKEAKDRMNKAHGEGMALLKKELQRLLNKSNVNEDSNGESEFNQKMYRVTDPHGKIEEMSEEELLQLTMTIFQYDAWDAEVDVNTITIEDAIRELTMSDFIITPLEEDNSSNVEINEDHLSNRNDKINFILNNQSHRIVGRQWSNTQLEKLSDDRLNVIYRNLELELENLENKNMANSNKEIENMENQDLNENSIGTRIDRDLYFKMKDLLNDAKIIPLRKAIEIYNNTGTADVIIGKDFGVSVKDEGDFISVIFGSTELTKIGDAPHEEWNFRSKEDAFQFIMQLQKYFMRRSVTENSTGITIDKIDGEIPYENNINENDRPTYYQVSYYATVGEHGHLGSSSADFNSELRKAIKFYVDNKKENTLDELEYIGVDGNGNKFAIIYITQEYFNKITEMWFKDKVAYEIYIKAAKKALQSPGKAIVGEYKEDTDQGKLELDENKDQSNEIEYKGKIITKLFPSGMYEYYSDSQERFLKFDDLDDAKRSIDSESNISEENNDIDLGRWNTPWLKTYYLDKDGDKVYKIPFAANTIDELINIDDERLEEFLYSELGSGDSVETTSGNIFVGSDIQDHLKHDTLDENQYKSDEDIEAEFSEPRISEFNFPGKYSNKRMGDIAMVFPSAEEHVGGGASDEGIHEIVEDYLFDENSGELKFATNHWYPEETYNWILNQIMERLKQHYNKDIKVVTSFSDGKHWVDEATDLDETFNNAPLGKPKFENGETVYVTKELYKGNPFALYVDNNIFSRSHGEYLYKLKAHDTGYSYTLPESKIVKDINEMNENKLEETDYEIIDGYRIYDYNDGNHIEIEGENESGDIEHGYIEVSDNVFYIKPSNRLKGLSDKAYKILNKYIMNKYKNMINGNFDKITGRPDIFNLDEIANLISENKEISNLFSQLNEEEVNEILNEFHKAETSFNTKGNNPSMANLNRVKNKNAEITKQERSDVIKKLKGTAPDGSQFVQDKPKESKDVENKSFNEKEAKMADGKTKVSDAIMLNRGSSPADVDMQIENPKYEENLKNSLIPNVEARKIDTQYGKIDSPEPANIDRSLSVNKKVYDDYKKKKEFRAEQPQMWNRYTTKLVKEGIDDFQAEILMEGIVKAGGLYKSE